MCIAFLCIKPCCSTASNTAHKPCTGPNAIMDGMELEWSPVNRNDPHHCIFYCSSRNRRSSDRPSPKRFSWTQAKFLICAYNFKVAEKSSSPCLVELIWLKQQNGRLGTFKKAHKPDVSDDANVIKCCGLSMTLNHYPWLINDINHTHLGQFQILDTIICLLVSFLLFSLDCIYFLLRIKQFY